MHPTIPLIKEFLRKNGASIEDSTLLEFVERGMTHIYRIHHPEIWYLKFTPQKTRSSGAFYPKRLWAPTTEESRLHGVERRARLRPLIDTINAEAGRHFLIPPYPLDQEGNIWEAMTPGPEEIEHPKLADHLATGWLAMDALANPHHGGSPYLWDPKTYPASNLHELALHLKAVSDLAIVHLDGHSQSSLTHERDRYLHYESLVKPFLETWGLEQFSLQEILKEIDNPYSLVWKQLLDQAKKRLVQIDERIVEIQKTHHLPQDMDLEQMKRFFYKKYQDLFLQGEKPYALERTPHVLQFFHCVFVLEREGLVAEETRLLGRSLAQCAITHQLANDLIHRQGVTTKALLEVMHKIERYYEEAQRAPKSLIHGNAHPHEFLQDPKGNWILGGCEYLHVGCVYGDIAEQYIRKLVRDYLQGKTGQKETLEKMQAVLIPGWFDGFWPDIMGHCVIGFAQELETLFLAYSMDSANIDFLNLTITPDTYLQEMRERLSLEICYRNKLLPLLKKTQKCEEKS